MKSIRYNLSSQKKLRARKVFLIAFLLVLFTLASAGGGIWRLTTENRLQRDEIEELNILKEKFSDVRNMITDYRDRIDVVRKKWGKKINFANNLIDRKAFSITEKMNLLENLMPDGVFLSSLILVNGPKNVIQLGCLAGSFKKLLALYKSLSGHRVSIKKETVLEDGLYRADLMVTIKDEKN